MTILYSNTGTTFTNDETFVRMRFLTVKKAKCCTVAYVYTIFEIGAPSCFRSGLISDSVKTPLAIKRRAYFLPHLFQYFRTKELLVKDFLLLEIDPLK